MTDQTPAEPLSAAIARCGDHPQFGTSTRDTLLLGCGRPLTEETDDRLAYRCAECRTVFCRSCIRQHFGWPEAGGGPMPHALDAALATLAATRASVGAGLREALVERHNRVCLCPFDGSDEGCNLTLAGAQLGALLQMSPASEEETP